MTMNRARGGVGLPTIVFVVFLILKLTGTIAWSWWWVTAPLWVPSIIGVVIAVAVFVTTTVLEWGER